MRAEIGELLVKETQNSCYCGWGAGRNDRYRELSLEYSPLKMIEVPVSEVIRRMKMVSCEGMERTHHSASSRWGKSYYHEPLEYTEALAEKVETAKRRVGICIDCLRSSDGAESCRFKHE